MDLLKKTGNLIESQFKQQQPKQVKEDEAEKQGLKDEGIQTNRVISEPQTVQPQQKSIEVEQPQKEPQTQKPTGSFGMFTSSITKAGENILAKGKQTLNETYEVAQDRVGQLQVMATQVQNAAQQKLTQFSDAFQKMMLEKKKQINVWMRQKMLEKIDELVQKGRPYAKEQLKDDDMCGFVKTGVDDFVDTLWPDLKEEIHYLVQCEIDQPLVTVVDRQVPIFCAPCNCIRATYLYAMMPYDRTIWQQIQTFWWWFFTLIESIPISGVQPLFYSFIYMCIDQGDEYQLVSYILGYQTMQFVTQGVISATTAYVQYYNCTTLNQNDQKIRDDCFDEGPGAPRDDAIFEFAVFCLQVVLVWLAFFMLPCSQPQGKPKFLHEDQSITQANQEQADKNFDTQRGGILVKFMIYDIIAFGASVVVMILTYNYANVKDYTYAAPFIYFGKTVYGYLSFPFLIFQSEFLMNMLTQSQPTAYDRKGNTVPAKDGIDIQYQDQYGQTRANLDVDIEDMFGQTQEVENLQ